MGTDETGARVEIILNNADKETLTDCIIMIDKIKPFCGSSSDQKGTESERQEEQGNDRKE